MKEPQRTYLENVCICTQYWCTTVPLYFVLSRGLEATNIHQNKIF